MKKQFIILLLQASAVCCVGQFPSTFRADNDSLVEQEIKQLEYFLVGLLEKGDIATYAGYLTDDYVRIAANGAISTKEQVLNDFQQATAKVTMKPHDLQVRVYGNTAILRGILDLETRSGDQVTKRTSIITKVFIKRDAGWYMASLQGTALP